MRVRDSGEGLGLGSVSRLGLGPGFGSSLGSGLGSGLGLGYRLLADPPFDPGQQRAEARPEERALRGVRGLGLSEEARLGLLEVGQCNAPCLPQPLRALRWRATALEPETRELGLERVRVRVRVRVRARAQARAQARASARVRAGAGARVRATCSALSASAPTAARSSSALLKRRKSIPVSVDEEARSKSSLSGRGWRRPAKAASPNSSGSSACSAISP